MSSRDGSITVVSPWVTVQVRRSGLDPTVSLTWPSGLTTWASFIGTTRWLRRVFVCSCARPRVGFGSWAEHRLEKHSATASAGMENVLLDAGIVWFSVTCYRIFTLDGIDPWGARTTISPSRVGKVRTSPVRSSALLESRWSVTIAPGQG